MTKTNKNTVNYVDLSFHDNDYEFVSHPSHYVGKNGLEVNDVLEEFGLGEGYRLGSAIKYIIRAGKKPGESAEKDLSKAIELIAQHIEYLNK